MEINKQKITEEKNLKAANGMGMLFLCIIGLLGSVALFIAGMSVFEGALQGILAVLSIIIFIAACIGFGGLKVINPNEALVLALFGNYYGTLKNDGFFWVNPFCSAINPTVKKYVSASAGNGAAVNIGGEGSKKYLLRH